MNKFVDEVDFNDPVTGINSIWAGIYIGGLFIFIEYGFLNIMQGITGKSLIQYMSGNKNYFILLVLTLVGFAGLFNYLVLFKKDKYLIYFYEFEQMSKNQKRKYSWSCFVAIILIISFLITSFVFIPQQ